VGFGFHIQNPAMLPASVPYVLAAALAMIFLYSLQASSSKSRLPLLNPRKTLELSDTGPKSQFLTKSRGMLEAWFRDHPDKAARVIGDAGEVIVLPPRLAHEIRNDPRLSFAGWVRKNFHAHIPGFDGFREGSQDSGLVQTVIMKDLTKYLSGCPSKLPSAAC
jgi:hypothetical protein